MMNRFRNIFFFFMQINDKLYLSARYLIKVYGNGCSVEITNMEKRVHGLRKIGDTSRN